MKQLSEHTKHVILKKLAKQSASLGWIVNEKEALQNPVFDAAYLNKNVWGPWSLIEHQLKHICPEVKDLKPRPAPVVKKPAPKKASVGEKNGKDI